METVANDKLSETCSKMIVTDDATGEHYEDRDEQGNAYVPTWLVETNTQHSVLQQQL